MPRCWCVARSSAAAARPARVSASADLVEHYAPQVVALIAEPPCYERIAVVLERLGIEFTLLACADELDADWTDDRAAVVILHATAASIAQEIGQLAQHAEHSPVVAICADLQRWEVRAALAAGASGVVLEDDLEQTLGPCLLAVCTGQVCVPRRHGRQIDPPVLSTREKQILGLVVMGYMNSQIAEQLFLAESTVKSHLSSAFGKLGVRSRNEAVNLILDSKQGLGTGILALGGERLETTSAGAQ